MSMKYFCDMCNKEIEDPIWVRYKAHNSYCEDCWTDEKNWKIIHESRKEHNEA